MNGDTVKTTLGEIMGRFRRMAQQKHDEADRLYHARDWEGGYGQRCRALGIEDALKSMEAGGGEAVVPRPRGTGHARARVIPILDSDS